MRSMHVPPLVLCVLAGVSLAAQQPPPRPAAPARQPAVTFKVEVDYVEIDAVVTDQEGNFVRNLGREDFEVLEDGKPQAVTAFAVVDLPIERVDPPLFRGAPVEPDVASNRRDLNGRIFVLVLDDLQTAFHRTRRVVAAARQFVRRHVGANDLVAVIPTSGRSELAQELTTSQSRVIAAIDRFTGRKLTGATSDQELASHARATYDSLRNLAEYLGGVRGRRKAIVWFGEGVEYDVTNPFASPSADVVRQQMIDTIGAATRANVSFYSIDPRGIGAGLDEAIEISGLPDDTGGMVEVQDRIDRAHDSLRTISAETGGFAVVNQTDLTEAFARIVRENSSYYVLGYYASDQRRDGRFRPVQVRVRRPGLEVRARKGYTAPRGRPSTADRSLKVEASAPLREALNSPIPAVGLGLSVFAAPFTGSSGKASVAVIVEFEAGQLTFAEKDGVFVNDLEVVAIAIDSSGRIQDGGRDEAPMKLSRGSRDAVMQSGLRLTRRLSLRPGRYQIRVAARESNTASLGAVSLDLEVPNFTDAPLLMSGLAVTSGFAGRTVTANPDPAFKDILPAPPTTRREFPAGDTVSLFAEIYDNQRTPHRVAIRTTVTADDGRVVFTAADERRSDELGGTRGGGFGHTATVPLAGLAAGRYVLRVEAQTLLSGGATAARELEFRIR